MATLAHCDILQKQTQNANQHSKKQSVLSHRITLVIVEPTTEEGIPYTILYPYMPTDFRELQRSWIQLMKERDTYKDQFHAQKRKVLELTKQLHKERGLNVYLGTKRKHPWEF